MKTINHDCKAPECATCQQYNYPEYEDVMIDAFETFDGDSRDGFNGGYTLEQVNIAAYKLGIINLSEYQTNRIALEKLAF